MFPVKIGNEIDVKTYSDSLIKGERQLLVTVEGNMFITNGDGTYNEFKGNNAKEKIEALKDQLDIYINDNFNIVNEKLLELEKLISDVDTSLKESLSNLAKAIEVELQALELGIETLELEVATLEVALEEVIKDLKSSNEKIAALELGINDIEDSLYLLQEKVNTNISDIKSLSDKVTSLNDETTLLNDKVISLEEENASLKAKINELENKVYTKEEIDNMQIPATRVTVDVTMDGVSKNVSLQEAMDYLFSGNFVPPTEPEKPTAVCGKFKAGQVLCGGTEEATKPKAVCGEFKAGQVVCGSGTIAESQKAICGTFKAGGILVGTK